MGLASKLAAFAARLTSDSKVPQTALAANVAGNGPAFSAYKSAAQTGIVPSTWTKIAFQTEEFDTASAFDNNTNYRFQPLVAGYYQVNWQLDVGGTSMSLVIADIYKNGSNHKRSCGFAATQAEAYVNGSALVYLNGSTDYIEVYLYVAAGANATVYGNAVHYSYFQASLARAA
mgnify:CR=1 FL=1